MIGMYLENVFQQRGGESLASIKDVARQAGVAISTVSKVLNGYEGVSESTKDKVNAAIEALNLSLIHIYCTAGVYLMYRSYKRILERNS